MRSVLSFNKYFWLIFSLFLLLHILLFNVNVAEWGDSYRILRAARFVKEFSYPASEKRPPLFSIVLATQPEVVDPVIWGRFIVLLFSVASFFIFYFMLNLVSQTIDKRGIKTQTLGLLLFALNPVYLYWSIRIMADIPASFIFLLAIFLLIVWKQNLTVIRCFVLGVVVALSVLMRFEGYILFVSVGFGILLQDKKPFQINDFLKYLRRRLKPLFSYVLSFSVVMFPYFLYRDPFNSSYFEEPTGRTYDLQMMSTYLLSLLFLFGFTSAFFFLINCRDTIRKYFEQNPAIFLFVFLELILILFWPAAIPRLFVAIIPFLIIPLTDSIIIYFRGNKRSFPSLLILGSLLGIYVISQYLLKLQFLVVFKSVFIITILLQISMIIPIFLKKFNLFIVILFVSMFVWSLSIIWTHRDVFKVIKEASVYASQNLDGKIGYNDVSSVASWYLGKSGTYFNILDKGDDEYRAIKDKGLDYILVTNEHNPTLEFDVTKRSYLEQVKEFRYTIRDTEFFTLILEVK